MNRVLRLAMINVLLVLAAGTAAMAEASIKFRSVDGTTAFGLSVSNNRGVTVYESEAATVEHSITIPADFFSLRFEEFFLSFTSPEGAVIGDVKALVDRDSTGPQIRNVSLFSDDKPTLEELLTVVSAAARDPLSGYLYAQFLEAAGTDRLSVDYEVLISYLEIQSLFHLACRAPNFWLFDAPDDYDESIQIISILERAVSTASNFDENYAKAIRRWGIDGDDILDYSREIPFCEWKRYEVVARAAGSSQIENAIGVATFFQSLHGQLTEEEREIVLSVSRVDRNRIEEDITYLSQLLD